MMLLQVSGTIASGAATAVFAWLVWDFVRVNLKYDESVLLSSSEGVDELSAREKR